MSEEKNDSDSKKLPDPSDPEWDVALERWEEELAAERKPAGESTAESQRRFVKPPRPVYRPPTPRELSSRASVDPRPKENNAFESEEDESTRVAEIPATILRSLGVPSVSPVARDEAADELIPITLDLPSEKSAVEPASERPEVEEDIDEHVGSTSLDSAMRNAPSEVVAEPGGGQPDSGAAAALRTVRSRKPRDEHLSIVGASIESQRARAEMLRQMADNVAGEARGRLLVASAELLERCGEIEPIVALYAAALESDPRNLVALRACRRLAVASRDWPHVAALLEQEVRAAASAEDRRMGLTALAEVQLRRLQDPAAAERAAREALGLGRRSAAAALLLAEACFAQKRNVEARASLERAAESTQDLGLRAAILTDLGQGLEGQGQLRRADEMYEKALRTGFKLFSSLLARARTSRSEGDLEGACDCLLQAADQVSNTLTAEAFRVVASRWLCAAGNVAAARGVLSDVRATYGLRARVQTIRAEGDLEDLAVAIEQWVERSGGVERARALVALSEAYAERGDAAAAEKALRKAAFAEAPAGLLKVVREVLSRRFGEDSDFGSAAAAADALTSAAIAARKQDPVEHERELLRKAAQDDESTLTVDVLALDCAAACGDEDAIQAALRRQADRSAPARKVGPLLALAERVSVEAARELYLEALRCGVDSVVLQRALARIDLRGVVPEPSRLLDAADHWSRQAARLEGSAAAFSYTQASRLMALGGAPSEATLMNALGALPGYPAAAWALERLAHRSGDSRSLLRQVHEELADAAVEADEAVGRLVAASAFEPVRSVAESLIERARALSPDDPVVAEIAARLARPAARASLLASRAAESPSDWRWMLLMRAGAASESAEDFPEAADLYRQAAAILPEDPLTAYALDRAERLGGQLSRVGERRFHKVREAQDVASKTSALEELAEFDLFDRGDAASAILSWLAVLDADPGHIPALRALERQFMAQPRDADLLAIERALVASAERPEEVTAHARLAVHLAGLVAEASREDIRAIVRAAVPRGHMDLWLARQQYAAALELDTGIGEAALEFAAQVSDPEEHVALVVRASGALEKKRGPIEAAEALEPAVRAAPGHPTAAEELGRLYESAERFAEAAETYEQAAKTAVTDFRRADLWYRAGALWEQVVDDSHRAIEAFIRAAEVDVTYLDVFDRLRPLLEAREDYGLIADLVQRRVEAGADAATLVELNEYRAHVCEQLGQREIVKESLRAALAVDPERLSSLHALAQACLADQDWPGAAEALIRSARLRSDRDHLRWVFLTLGEIYDKHLPDFQRAETALGRVIRLIPDEYEAREKLVALYETHGRLDKAAQVQREIVDLTMRPEQKRLQLVRLAVLLERQGNLRESENVLEGVRRQAPTDPQVLDALATLYERQHASTALSMHLSRAAADLRVAVVENPSQVGSWRALVDVLRRRGRTDAARCVASAAAAIGVVDVELSRVLDEEGPVGSVPGPAEGMLDDLLWPAELDPAMRGVFELAGDLIDRAVGFDLKAWKPEKITDSDHPLRRSAVAVAQWARQPDLSVYITRVAPRACVPVPGAVPGVLIGHELALGAGDELERRFLLTRAVCVAQAFLGPAVRTQPAHLALVLAGLVKACDPAFPLRWFDESAAAPMARRMHKWLSRKVKTQLTPLVVQMGGAPNFDPMQISILAWEVGDRAALLATGSVAAALSSLGLLAGAAGGSQRRPVELVRDVAEASSVLSFSISEAYLEARRRCRES